MSIIPKPEPLRSSQVTFRTSNGNLLLSALFLERVKYRPDSTKEHVRYSLHRLDQDSVPSLYRLYLEFGDISEYRFATTYFESYEHWTTLCSLDWFFPLIAKWRVELAAKIKSEALDRIMTKARDGDFQANKFILDTPWVAKSPRRVGRPVKEPEVIDPISVTEDYERLFNKEKSS